jgi:hypothetical protein
LQSFWDACTAALQQLAPVAALVAASEAGAEVQAVPNPLTLAQLQQLQLTLETSLSSTEMVWTQRHAEALGGLRWGGAPLARWQVVAAFAHFVQATRSHLESVLLDKAALPAQQLPGIVTGADGQPLSYTARVAAVTDAAREVYSGQAMRSKRKAINRAAEHCRQAPLPEAAPQDVAQFLAGEYGAARLFPQVSGQGGCFVQLDGVQAGGGALKTDCAPPDHQGPAATRLFQLCISSIRSHRPHLCLLQDC